MEGERNCLSPWTHTRVAAIEEIGAGVLPEDSGCDQRDENERNCLSPWTPPSPWTPSLLLDRIMAAKPHSTPTAEKGVRGQFLIRAACASLSAGRSAAMFFAVELLRRQKRCAEPSQRFGLKSPEARKSGGFAGGSTPNGIQHGRN